MIRPRDAAQLAAEAERRCLAATGKRTPPSMDESGVHRDALGAAERMGILLGAAICLGSAALVVWVVLTIAGWM